MSAIAGSPAGAESTLVARLLAGEPAALARAITAVENDTADAAAILAAIQPRLGRAAVVGVTGPPGAGKSTLVGAYIGELRRRGKTVGVVAVDPSSPLSGGAVLGDRIRMSAHAGDPDVFVRSLASRGHLGGLSPATSGVIDVMDAAGKDVVIVETVGAGQAEVEVAEVADTRIVVCAPGLGDEVQAIKAGILEIADILVVNKSDLPQADYTRRQLTGMLQLRRQSDWAVPVLATTATSGDGVAALADAVARHAHHSKHPNGRSDPRARIRRLLGDAAARVVRERVCRGDDAALETLCDAVQRGELTIEAAAERLVDNTGASGI